MPPEIEPQTPGPQTPPSTPPPVPPTPGSADAPSPLKQIRTFQGDVANALGEQKESLFSIQQAERLKASSGMSIPQPSDFEEERKRKETLYFALGGLVLILLGGLGVWFGYGEFRERSAPPVIAVPESRFIAVQSEENLNFASSSRETLLSLITDKSRSVPIEEIKHFALKKGSSNTAPLATAAEFLTLLETRAPGNLVRSFGPIFMLGTLGQSRFLIFKLSSFENAFPGMLAWESSMARDVGPLFIQAEALKSIGSESVFKDVISRNKDVRILEVGGAPALLYSFFDNQMLIITDNLETLRVLVDRLTQELLSR